MHGTPVCKAAAAECVQMCCTACNSRTIKYPAQPADMCRGHGGGALPPGIEADVLQGRPSTSGSPTLTCVLHQDSKWESVGHQRDGLVVFALRRGAQLQQLVQLMHPRITERLGARWQQPGRRLKLGQCCVLLGQRWIGLQPSPCRLQGKHSEAGTRAFAYDRCTCSVQQRATRGINSRIADQRAAAACGTACPHPHTCSLSNVSLVGSSMGVPGQGVPTPAEHGGTGW